MNVFGLFFVYLGVRPSPTTVSAKPAVVESISLALDLSARSRSSWYLQLRKSLICSAASLTVLPRTISPWRKVLTSSCNELWTSSRHRSTPLRRSLSWRHCSTTEMGSEVEYKNQTRMKEWLLELLMLVEPPHAWCILCNWAWHWRRASISVPTSKVLASKLDDQYCKSLILVENCWLTCMCSVVQIFTLSNFGSTSIWLLIVSHLATACRHPVTDVISQAFTLGHKSFGGQSFQLTLTQLSLGHGVHYS